LQGLSHNRGVVDPPKATCPGQGPSRWWAALPPRHLCPGGFAFGGERGRKPGEGGGPRRLKAPPPFAATPPQGGLGPDGIGTSTQRVKGELCPREVGHPWCRTRLGARGKSKGRGPSRVKDLPKRLSGAGGVRKTCWTLGTSGAGRVVGWGGGAKKGGGAGQALAPWRIARFSILGCHGGGRPGTAVFRYVGTFWGRTPHQTPGGAPGTPGKTGFPGIRKGKPGPLGAGGPRRKEASRGAPQHSGGIWKGVGGAGGAPGPAIPSKNPTVPTLEDFGGGGQAVSGAGASPRRGGDPARGVRFGPW